VRSERARKELVSKQRVEFLQAIEKCSKSTSNKEELLDAWCNYVGWARQTLLNGGKSGEFAMILNDCIRQFSSKEMMRDFHENFLFTRICCEFVDYCDKPVEFLQWMERRQVGLTHAKFWLTKARIMEESAKNFAGAEAALAEGIRRGAVPVDKLKAKQRQLEARVAARLTAPVEDAGDADEQRRQALGALAGASSGLAGGAAPQKRTYQENRKLQVASDEHQVDDLAPNNADQDEGWLDFGSQREAVKENANVARQWSKAKMPQKTGVAAAAAGGASRPGWLILEDGAEEDDAAARAVEAPVASAAPAAVKGAAPRPATKAVAIFEDENVQFGTSKAALSSRHQVAPALAAQQAKVKPVAKLPANERAVWNEESLCQEMLSFEELRAAKWYASNAARLEQERQQKLEQEAQDRRRQLEAEQAAARAAEEQRKEAERAAKKHAEERKRVAEAEAAAKKLAEQQQRDAAAKRAAEAEQMQQQQAMAKRAPAALNRSVHNKSIVAPVKNGGKNKLLDESRYGGDETLDTVNYEALVRNAAKTANLMDDLRNVFDDTIDLERRPQKSVVREPTINTRLVMEEVEKMFGESLALNDSAMVAPAPRAAAAPPTKLAVISDSYDESDSLEAFRTSMSMSAMHAGDSKKAMSAPALHKVSAPSNNNAAATPFEVFCDEDDDEASCDKSASLDAAAPSKSQQISFRPMSPIAEERQSNSDEIQHPLKAAVVVVDNPWPRLTTVPLAKLKACKGFVDNGARNSKLDDSKYLELDDGGVYDLSCQIGGGLESNVYRSEDVDNLDGEAMYALKITKPATPWEFWLNRQLQLRCTPDEMRHFATIASYHRFADKGMMFSVYREHGTLAALPKIWGAGMHEAIALFYACELLRLVELVHGKRILHNDVSLDNVLLVLDAETAHGDPRKTQHLELIDFSCALDLAEVDARTMFRGRGHCGFPCPEMSAGLAWSFQQDYCGVANGVHTLLFGQELQIVQRPDKRYEPANKLSRPGWQATELWTEFFLTLLNGPALCAGQFGESAAFLQGLRKTVQSSCDGMADQLMQLLKRQTTLIHERK
jgi:hypothetical protein